MSSATRPLNGRMTLSIRSILHDLQRRRVFRAAAVYAAVAYAVAQGASWVLPALQLPSWTVTLVVLLCIAGFPLTLVLSYVFDWTPGGLRQTGTSERHGASVAAASGSPPVAAAAPGTGSSMRMSGRDGAGRIAAGPASGLPSGAGMTTATAATGVDTMVAEPPEPGSIAVLPFLNLSSDPENEYFSDGVTEEILDALTKVGRLRVAARTSSFAFRGRRAGVAEIGSRLRVRNVLEGSVRRAGDRVRITAQLVDAVEGFHLWSETYDRQLSDIFALQAEIAGRIVSALRVTLTERERDMLMRPKTADVTAYDLYLRGRHFFHRLGRADFQHAVALFRRAIETDPGFARAYAGLADTLSFRFLWQGRALEDLVEAREAARKALELEPHLAEAHVSHGHVLSLAGDYEPAEAEFEEAIRLDPTLYEAYYFFARACMARGRPAEAARLFEQAHRIQPHEFQAIQLAATAYHALDRPDEVRRAAQESLEAIDSHLDLNPDDVRAVYFRACSLALLDRVPEAIAWAEKSLAMSPDDVGVVYNIGCMFATLGQSERALDLLERTVEIGSVHKDWVEHDSDWDAVRSHPRFRALIERLP